MILKTSLQQQMIRLITLPRKIELFLEDAENGELEFKVKNRKYEIKLFYALTQQIFFLICAGISYYFYQEKHDIIFYYTSIGSVTLLAKAFLSGLFYKRKLK